jgi:triphosphoribosyl-dephospho-CoA synthase
MEAAVYSHEAIVARTHEPHADCIRLERICLEALRHEAMAWPKPGLVTPVDAGSHRDMHIGTFLASIGALQGSFAALALAGARGQSFAVLQAIGIEAEGRMLCATGGVNTHRGAIFNLGLLVAAAARRQANSALADLDCGAVVARVWGEEIAAGRKKSPASHGNSVFNRFSAGGARTEASAGFPTVYNLGLPAMRRLVDAGHDRETAQIGTLLILMEHLHDTNLLWRDGESGLEFVHASAAAFNRAGGVSAPGWREQLLAMHREFVGRNLSPGGSADLLAASCAVLQLENFSFSG